MAKTIKPLKSQPKAQFSVYFPESMLEEIDIICSVTFMNRSAWLIQAAKEKLERERLERQSKIFEKLKDL